MNRLTSTGVAMAAVLVGAAMTHPVSGQETADAERYAGFSGQVRGEVVRVRDDGLVFRVARVVQVWDGNRAENPESLNGQLIGVGPTRAIEGEADFGRARLQGAFLKRLEPGAELTLEVHNPDGRGFRILELTEEQRALARAVPAREGRPAVARGGEARVEREQAVARERAMQARLVQERAELREVALRDREGAGVEARERMADMERALHARELLVEVLRDELRKVHVENAELRLRLERMEAAMRDQRG